MGQSDQFFDMASPQGEDVNLALGSLDTAQRAAYARLATQLRELVP
jgi:hypothetical protein